MIEPKYKLFVKDLSNDDEFDIPFLNLNFTDQLNIGKNARFTLSFPDIEKVTETYKTTPLFLLTGGLREIFVQKDSTNVYLGVITDVDIGKDDKGLLQIRVASVGFSTLLKKRRTAELRKFVSTDAGEIAFTLIDESQTSDPPFSDFGITEGLIETSVGRDRTFRFSQVLDAIQKMSNENLLNGFDFEVDNEKKFNVFFPEKGSQRENIFIDSGNILRWKFRKPLVLNLTNQVYVLGEGFDDNLVFTKRTSPVPFRSAFNLLEDVLSERDTGEIPNLEDKGDKFLLDNQSPILNLQLMHRDDDPDILDYDVGDSIRVALDEVDIKNEFKRITQRAVNIDTQLQAVVTLTVE